MYNACANGSHANTPALVIAGLDPVIHDESHRSLTDRMDHRVRPCDDGE